MWSLHLSRRWNAIYQHHRAKPTLIGPRNVFLYILFAFWSRTLCRVDFVLLKTLTQPTTGKLSSGLLFYPLYHPPQVAHYLYTLEIFTLLLVFTVTFWTGPAQEQGMHSSSPSAMIITERNPKRRDFVNIKSYLSSSSPT